jgi:hypothetical protein
MVRTDVAGAATALADYAVRLHGQRGRCVLVHRGCDPLWDFTADALRGRGFDVERVGLDERDRRWRPAAAWAGTGGGACLLVHHDPFGPVENATGAETRDLRTLTDAGVSCLFVEFPHAVNGALGPAVAGAYYAMLEYSADDVESLRSRWSAVLADADRIEIAVAGTTLTVRPPWSVHTDWSAMDVFPVLQVPFGELWVVCDPALVSGESIVQLGTDRYGKLRVVDGEATVDGTRLRGGLVELGFGTNPSALDPPTGAIAEKRLGRVHLGFGDSVFIGGDTSDATHSDLLLPRAVEVRAVTGDAVISLRISGDHD